MQTDSALIDLMQLNFKNVDVISKIQTPSDEFDIVVPVMDLPYALKMDFSVIPFSEAYICPDTVIKNKFSQLSEFKNDKYKIGIFWQGNKRILKNRSIDISMIVDLVKGKDKIQFYSLQIENDLPGVKELIPLSPYIKNFNDTAALLSNLDLVITVDSSIVHLSGALGVNTYLLLPNTPEWRWFNDDKTTPWYNSVKIFKQKKIGDWKAVLKRVNTRLMKL